MSISYLCVYLDNTRLIDDNNLDATIVEPPLPIWPVIDERGQLLATLLQRFQQFLPPHDAMIALDGVAHLMMAAKTTNGTVLIIQRHKQQDTKHEHNR